MGMRLLSPFAQKDKQQEEITRKILRTQEVNEMASIADVNLARTQQEFNSALALNRSKWVLEEEEHANRIKDMSKEIEALEERKKQALIPINVYKKEIDILIKEAQEIVKQAKEKEEQADYLLEKLETKLTDVSDRETIVSDEEKRLTIARQGIEIQQETTKQGVEQLSKEMILFHEKQRQEEENLLKRKKEVALAEISFNSKTKKYARDIEALKIWEIQLKDERETLDREYKRKK